MAAYKTWVEAALDNLLAALKAYGTLNATVKEWRVGVKNRRLEYSYPAVVLMPRQDSIEDSETHSRHHRVEVEILLLTRSLGDAQDTDDFDKGFKEHKDILGDLHDAVAGQRDGQLSASVLDIKVLDVVFDVSIGENQVLYAGSLSVELLKEEA